MEAIAAPRQIQRLCGSMTDVDSHEQMPAQQWVASMGAQVKGFADAYMAAYEGDRMSLSDPDFSGDVTPIGPEVAVIKGTRAPGGTDRKRRLDVMDALGIKRQLMFPTGVGILGLLLRMGKPLPFAYDTDETMDGLGKRLLNLYAEWAL